MHPRALRKDGDPPFDYFCIMRILLMLPKPSAHWSGMANLIGESDGLRDDVTVVVDGERVRFFDAGSNEMAVHVPRHILEAGTIPRLRAKLSFLQWLHERFPRAVDQTFRRERTRWPVHTFSKPGSGVRSLRFGEAVSTR